MINKNNKINGLEQNQKIIKYNKLLDIYKKRDMKEFKKEMVQEIPKIIFNNGKLIQPFESFKHVYSRFLDFIEYLKGYKYHILTIQKRIIYLKK